MAKDPKNSEEDKTEASEELSSEELEQVAGGAAYIKFDGVDGESKGKDHKGWSDLLSFGQSLSRKR